MWTAPGSLLWLPTAVNAFIAAEIFQIFWERYGPRGHLSAGTAQAELDPFMHIILISGPISLMLLVGWAIVAVVQMKVPPSGDSPKDRGARALLLANVLAPIALWFALRLT